MKNKGYLTYISVLNYVIIVVICLSFFGGNFKEDSIYQVISIILLIPFVLAIIFLKKFIKSNFEENKKD